MKKLTLSLLLVGVSACDPGSSGSPPEVDSVRQAVVTPACVKNSSDLSVLRRTTVRGCSNDADCAVLPRGVCVGANADAGVRGTCGFDSSCLSDSDCTTCGSSCDVERGQCWAQCLENADCAAPGQTCGPRGTCIQAAASISPVFELSPAVISFTAKGNLGNIVVTGPRATAALPIAVTVTTATDVRLECPSPVPQGTACTCVAGQPRCSLTLNAPAGPSSGPRSLELRAGFMASSAATAPASRTVHFVTPEMVLRTELTLIESPVLQAPTAVSGRYEGSLELVESGIGSTLERSAFAGRRVPVTIDVQPEGAGYVLFVRDPIGVMGSGGRVVLRAQSCTNGRCALTLMNADHDAPADRVRLVTRPVPATTALGGVVNVSQSWTIRMAEGRLSTLFGVETSDRGRGISTASVGGPVQSVTPPSNIGASMQWRLTAQRMSSTFSVPSWAPRSPSSTVATPLPLERTPLEVPRRCTPWRTAVVFESGCNTEVPWTVEQYCKQGGINCDVDREADQLVDECATEFRDSWDAFADAVAANQATTCELPDPRFPRGFIPCGTISGKTHATWDSVCYFSEVATSDTAWCRELSTKFDCKPGSIDLDGAELAGCFLPTWANDDATCAQRVVCRSGGVFTSATFAPTSDLMCAPSAPLATPSMPPAERFLYASNGADRPADWLRWCMADLEQVSGVASSSLQTGACMNAIEFTNAVVLASRSSRPIEGTTASNDAMLLHRFAAQWLDVAAFTAREANLESMLEPVVPGVTPSPSRDRALDAVEKGLGLLTHPRVAAALARFDGSLLRNPDYRVRLFGPRNYSQGASPQAVGLPVALLSSSALYVDLLHAHVDETANAGTLDVVRTHRVLRQVQTLEAIANGLHQRSCSPVSCAEGGAPPAWEPHYVRAQAQLVDAVTRLMLRLESARGPTAAGQEVPVWFYGNNVPGQSVSINGPGEEHHAASRRLLQFATDQIPAARDREEQLIDAWRTFYSDTFTARVQRRQQAERITDTANAAGRGVRELCGSQVRGSGVLDDARMFEWVSNDGGIATHVDTSGDGVSDVGVTSCFVRTADAACRPTATQEQLYTSSTEADQRLALCLGGLVAQKNPPTGTGAFEVMGRSLAAGDPVALTLGATFDRFGGVPMSQIRVRFGINQARREYVVQLSQLFAGLTLGPLTSADFVRCSEPAAMRGGKLPSPATQPASPYGNKQCLQGVLGEDMVATYTAIEAARAASLDVSGYLERYALRAEHCRSLEALHLGALQESQAYTQRMSQLAQERVRAAASFGFFSFLLDAVTLGASGGKFPGLPDPFAPAENLNAAQLDAKMEQARNEHANAQQHFSSLIDLANCHGNARETMIGVEAAVARARQAELQVAAATTRLFNDQARLVSMVTEAHAAIARESQTCDRPNATGTCVLGYTYLDLRAERMRDHAATFARAQHAALLAANAAEYELQASLSSRSCILQAKTVASLKTTCLVGLQGALARPSPTSVVPMRYSLCAVLFPTSLAAFLSQGSTFNAGDCDVQAFRQMLKDPRYSIPNSPLNGQRIPFRIEPAPVVVPYWAERINGVAIAFAGGAVSGNAALVGVGLGKRNTFASHLAPVLENDVLVSRLRDTNLLPCRNVLLPAGIEDSAPRDPRACAADGFSTIAVNALTPLDPSQPTLLTSQAAVNSSIVFGGALAGRGVFGDYQLVLPMAQLDVDRIDDIWIVFDVRSH